MYDYDTKEEYRRFIAVGDEMNETEKGLTYVPFGISHGIQVLIQPDFGNPVDPICGIKSESPIHPTMNRR